MRYFNIKMKLKNDENQLTICYLTSVENDAELQAKKVSFLNDSESLSNYDDETQELTPQQAVAEAKYLFEKSLTRIYKEDHLGLKDQPVKDVLDLLKRDLSDGEMFNAIIEHHNKTLTIRRLDRDYDLGKISAKEFLELVDKLINEKDIKKSEKYLSKLTKKQTNKKDN